MKPADDREETLFRAALQRPAGPERQAFLDGACAGEPALRQRLEALLQGHESPGPGLEPDAPRPEQPTIRLSLPEAEGPGTRIGRYKLLQKIGEGGMGIVFMAEQTEPVRRRVALKIIKLGMDTRQVVARFEAERQALALMDHPNIARVLDGGATGTGRLFFVMELVRGIPLTRYADEKRLNTETRLRLFVQVCQAIQHAHQKGIIHRDIKPSNILVADHDGVPVPKIIDFGIAKATTGQPLTDKTLFTAFEQFVGTPAYMSPEQAQLSGLDVDTRSDIYSLGVLLYELLSGQTPFEVKRLVAAGLDEIRRIIREEDPMRPSTRLNTLNAQEQTAVAKHRGTEAPKLIGLLHGDLDWIVMKALDKDRTRRYETANGLAMDVQRHLDNEPVVARPPSRLYRFGKTVRRNKLAFAAAAAVVASLAAGFGLSTWLFFRERESRKVEVAAVQERLREQERVEQQRQRAEQEQRLRQLGGLTREVMAQGKWAEAESLLREKLALQKQLLGAENPDVAESLVDLGAVLVAQRNWTNSEVTLRAALAMDRKFLKEKDPKFAGLFLLLWGVLGKEGRDTEAEALIGNQQKGLFQWRGDDFSFTAAIQSARFLPALQAGGLMSTSLPFNSMDTNSVMFLAGRARAFITQGDFARADGVLSSCLTPDFLKQPECAPMLKVRADFLARRGRWDEAAADYSRLVKFDAADHTLHHSLAPLLVQTGDLEGYRRHCAEMLARFGGTSDAAVAERMVKDCLIVPIPGVDLKAVAQLAQAAVTQGNSPGLAFVQFAKGLADYRTGDYAGAAALMGQVIAAGGVPFRGAQASAVLAMAQSRLHRPGDAEAALAQGAAIFGQMTGPQSGGLIPDWTDWIIAHALLSEAESVVHGTSANTPANK